MPCVGGRVVQRRSDNDRSRFPDRLDDGPLEPAIGCVGVGAQGVGSARLGVVSTSRYLLLVVALAVFVPAAIAGATLVGASQQTSFTCLGVGVVGAPSAATPEQAVAKYVASKVATSDVEWTRWDDDPRVQPANVVTLRPQAPDAGRQQVGSSLLEVVRASDTRWSVRGACQ